MKTTYFISYVLFVLMVSLSLSYASEPAPSETIGRVLWVTGTLKAQLPHTESRMLKRNSPVYEHDTLTTDPVSSGVILIIKDSSTLTVPQNTTVNVNDYVKKTTTQNNGLIARILRLIRKTLRAITGIIRENAPGGYQLKQ